MTMTASLQENEQVQQILQALRGISAQVKAIDAELGTDSSGPVAQRNKVAKQYIAQYLVSQGQDENGREKNDALRYINQAVGAIASLTAGNEELLSAVVTELSNQIDSKYGDAVKKHLQTKVDAQPKSETPEISDARKTELASERSKLTQLFKLQNDILKVYGLVTLPDDIEVPPVRRGPVGPRINLNREFQFYVDGKLKQLKDEDGNVTGNYKLSNVANQYTKKDLNWSTAQLRDFIVEHVDGASINEGELTLPDEWEVTLPAPVNKTLRGVAVRVTDANANVDDSDDDDEDDNNGGDLSNF